jgi:hypothetical protein
LFKDLEGDQGATKETEEPQAAHPAPVESEQPQP